MKLVIVNTGDNGLKRLYVVQSGDFQDSFNPQVTANINGLEPKVSDAYYQWGNTPMKSKPYDPSAAEDVEMQAEAVDDTTEVISVD